MMDRHPDDAELSVTYDVLAWLRDYTEKYEPYAVGLLNALEEVINSLPQRAPTTWRTGPSGPAPLTEDR